MAAKPPWPNSWLTQWRHLGLLISLLPWLLTGSVALAAPSGYFSYLGGINNESIYAGAIDANGATYLVGQTHSNDFPGSATVFNSPALDQNCFLSKIDLADPRQNRTIIFGGSGNEVCRGILVDSDSTIYLIGETQSPDFPVTDNSRLQGQWDGFLIKMDQQFNILLGTYIGGSATDFAHGLALYQNDQLVVVGETWSQDLSTTRNAYIDDCQLLEICDHIHANAFLTVFDKTDFHLNYASYLGGKLDDKAHHVVTFADNIVVLGETQSTDFPLVKPLSNNLKGGLDGFIAQLQIDQHQPSDQLLFASYFGGNANDNILLAVMDDRNHLIFSGETQSDDLPVTANAFSRQCGNGNHYCQAQSRSHSEAYLASLDLADHSLNYSTFVGGSKDEIPFALWLDESGQWWLGSMTESSDFPLTDNAWKTACCASLQDGFLLRLNPQQRGREGVSYATYVGGKQQDQLRFITTWHQQLILAGNSFSENLASNEASKTLQQNGDGFIQITKLPENGSYQKPDIKLSATPASGSLSLTILLGFFMGLLLGRTIYFNVNN